MASWEMSKVFPTFISNLMLSRSKGFPLQVEQPLRNKKCVWQKLLSKQRKRAVVACFRMAPLYNLPRSVSSTPAAPAATLSQNVNNWVLTRTF